MKTKITLEGYIKMGGKLTDINPENITCIDKKDCNFGRHPVYYKKKY